MMAMTPPNDSLQWSRIFYGVLVHVINQLVLDLVKKARIQFG